MITRIELDGFKTFLDFQLDLGPFQVILGANGAGKSNLFDALRLLSRLARLPVVEAFTDRHGRGTALEQFSLLPDGDRAPRLRLAVEALLDPATTRYQITHTRLRYTLTIERRMDTQGLVDLAVVEESLTALAPEADPWRRQYLPVDQDLPPLPGTPFIETVTTAAGSRLRAYYDGDQRMLWPSEDREYEEQTILSSAGSSPSLFRHAAAMQAELAALHILTKLDPDSLRQPSPILARRTARLGVDGRGLAGILARLEAEDPGLLADVSRDLAYLVPGMRTVRIETNPAQQEYNLVVDTQDGRSFPARVLSDGTLRLLALIALKNDPEYHGTLCLEEPENGVHPAHLQQMTGLLRDLASDLQDPAQAGAPLRQVLINTHSPVLVSALVQELGQPNGAGPYLVFARMPALVTPGGPAPVRVTRMAPVHGGAADPAEAAYTLHQVLAYLNTADPDESRVILAGDAPT
ncbi:MAG TPA: AAA family ATPase [Chloroflexia bacterium]|nr:AAA family ATPase [Chloroflexia bacterium]